MNKLLLVGATMLWAAQGPAAAQNTIKIGMTGALSGPAAVLGKDALAGLELAIDEINGAGGIKGQKIELISKDDEAKPPLAVNHARQLVGVDNVVVFFPSTNTTPNLATLQVTVPAGVPHVIAGTTSNVVCPLPGEGKECDKNVFRLSMLNSWQAEAIVKFTREKLKASKIAILYDSTEYGGDGHKLMMKILSAAGIKPVYEGTFELGEKNFRPHWTKAKEAGAEVAITWTLDFVVAQIAIQRKQLGFEAIKMIGPGAISGAALRRLGGDAVEGVYISDGFDAAVESKDPKILALMKRYQEKYKVEPQWGIPYWTTTYYDAMHWVARKIGEVGPDRAKLIDALSKSGKWDGTGVSYEIRPDKKNGRDPNRGVSIVMVKGGRLVNP